MKIYKPKTLAAVISFILYQGNTYAENNIEKYDLAGSADRSIRIAMTEEKSVKAIHSRDGWITIKPELIPYKPDIEHYSYREKLFATDQSLKYINKVFIPTRYVDKQFISSSGHIIAGIDSTDNKAIFISNDFGKTKKQINLFDNKADFVGLDGHSLSSLDNLANVDITGMSADGKYITGQLFFLVNVMELPMFLLPF